MLREYARPPLCGIGLNKHFVTMLNSLEPHLILVLGQQNWKHAQIGRCSG
jgi:hypothetical protein